MRTIEGMSVLITGGGSGIGAGTAKYFAERGAKVVIAGRREANLKEVATAIGSNVKFVVADVTVEADRSAMIAAALDHGGKLDVLFNNAGNITHTLFIDLGEDIIQAIM